MNPPICSISAPAAPATLAAVEPLPTSLPSASPSWSVSRARGPRLRAFASHGHSAHRHASAVAFRAPDVEIRRRCLGRSTLPRCAWKQTSRPANRMRRTVASSPDETAAMHAEDQNSVGEASALIRICRWKRGSEPPPFASSNPAAVELLQSILSGTASELPAIDLSESVAIQIYCMGRCRQPRQRAVSGHTPRVVTTCERVAPTCTPESRRHGGVSRRLWCRATRRLSRDTCVMATQIPCQMVSHATPGRVTRHAVTLVSCD